MKAIVLSYDKNHRYCELNYRMYMDLWPDCPFTFRIPWNEKKPKYFEHKDNVELIHCESPVYDTMQALLGDIPDDEWVYWCIDDRFPTKLDPIKMSELYSNLEDYKTKYDFVKPASALASTWAHRLPLHIPPGVNKQVKYKYSYELHAKGFAEQTAGFEWGYYLHQFCKPSYIKCLFNETHKHFVNQPWKAVSIYDYHHLLVYGFYDDKNKIGIGLHDLNNNYIVLNEPIINGQVTEIGKEYLEKLNINY